jgi:hypothetical protein
MHLRRSLLEGKTKEPLPLDSFNSQRISVTSVDSETMSVTKYFGCRQTAQDIEKQKAP